MVPPVQADAPAAEANSPLTDQTPRDRGRIHAVRFLLPATGSVQLFLKLARIISLSLFDFPACARTPVDQLFTKTNTSAQTLPPNEQLEFNEL